MILSKENRKSAKVVTCSRILFLEKDFQIVKEVFIADAGSHNTGHSAMKSSVPEPEATWYQRHTTLTPLEIRLCRRFSLVASLLYVMPEIRWISKWNLTIRRTIIPSRNIFSSHPQIFILIVFTLQEFLFDYFYFYLKRSYFPCNCGILTQILYDLKQPGRCWTICLTSLVFFWIFKF